MTIATVAELVAQERSSGSTDEQICRLLNASRTRPEVGRAWLSRSWKTPWVPVCRDWSADD